MTMTSCESLDLVSWICYYVLLAHDMEDTPLYSMLVLELLRTVGIVGSSLLSGLFTGTVVQVLQYSLKDKPPVLYYSTV